MSDDADVRALLARVDALDVSVSDARVGLIHDASMELHAHARHYEHAARHRVVVCEFEASGLASRCARLRSRPATDEELLRAHDAAHLRSVRDAFDPRGPELQVLTRDDDTGDDIYYTAHTAASARMAAGCVTEACEAVCRGDVQRAYAVVRPPGHHALCAQAMGFCFYNNVVVAARAALERDDISRVLILDWDVHHGNGVQDLTMDDASILYVSLHRWGNGFYPGTGAASEVGAKGTNVNVAWEEGGLGDADYSAAFDVIIEPVVRSFAPDLIIVAAGYDAADGDPIGGMKVTPAGYAHMTHRLCQIGSGRVVVALEGGYALRPLAASASATLAALLGDAPSTPTSAFSPRPSSLATLAELARFLAPHWPVLRTERSNTT